MSENINTALFILGYIVAIFIAMMFAGLGMMVSFKIIEMLMVVS